jgi:hypothetical protein
LKGSDGDAKQLVSCGHIIPHTQHGARRNASQQNAPLQSAMDVAPLLAVVLPMLHGQQS